MFFDEAMVIHSQHDDGRHWLTTVDVQSIQIWPVAPNHCRVGHFLAKVIAAKLATLSEDPSELVLTRADVGAVESLASCIELAGEAAEVRMSLIMRTGPAASGEDSEAGDESSQFLTPQPPEQWTSSYDAWITFAGRSLGMDAPDAVLDPYAHVQEIESATSVFQQRLPSLRTRYLAGMGGLSLGFKVGLTTGSGGKEYVWVRPVDWQNEQLIQCILESEPHDCKGYQAGQTLSLSVADLSDYAVGSEEAGLVEPGVTQRIAENYGLIIH